MLDTFFGIPAHFLSVGNNTSQNGGSIVSTESDHHQSDSSGVLLGLEFIEDVVDFSGDAIGSRLSRDTLVGVLG